MNTSLALVSAPASPASPASVCAERPVRSVTASEEVAADSYHTLVTRLSRASVKKHFDAYADVAWDDPSFRIDPEDPRWECTQQDPLGATEWYRSRPDAERARLGLALAAFQMKIGIAFESVLQRGLLELTSTLPNGSAEFRYAYHELIEEGQHSLMFQEFVNRSGIDVPGMTGWRALMARRVPNLGRKFPELFFLHVLGGETPIDAVQRQGLRRGDAVHPLQRRIMQIHVTEEARHVCFAERYLESHVPKLGATRLLRLRVMTPFVLRETAALILQPSRRFFDAMGVPRRVAAEAYSGPAYRKQVLDGIAPIRDLCAKLGVVTPALVPVWQRLGVWPAREEKKALPC